MQGEIAQLDRAIEAIRVRFGSQALTRAAELPPPPPWPSGTPLARLTGIGGVPCGGLTVLAGSRTSRNHTPGLALLDAAINQFAHSTVIGPSRAFPPRLLP